MELTCKEPPWVTIDPDLIISGELELADLERYWTSPMGDPGKKAPCCNCDRTLSIRESGLCQDCYEVAKGKRGSVLLNALTVFRAKAAKIQMAPINRVGGFDESFSPPKGIGKVNISNAPVPKTSKIAIPDKIHQGAAEDEREDEGIRVIDEDGNDLGRLSAYGNRLPTQVQPSVEEETPTAVTRGRQITPRIRRALIVEVGDVELEFRAGGDGIDIKIDDGNGVIFFAQNLELSLITELQTLVGSSKETA